MDEQDEGAKVGMWVVLGIITLLLFGLIGGLVIRTMNAKHAAKPAAVAAMPAAAPAASAVAEADVLVDVPLAGVVVVRVFFALDKSELQPDASAALTAQGCDPARVQLRKPEQTALGGPAEEARRVEVRLVD
jgi:hypothetical protein